MQTPEFQKKVTDGFEDLNDIRRKWDNIIWGLTPGTADYKNARTRKNLERYRVLPRRTRGCTSGRR